ncbi:ATP synthase F1 subunit delta [Candidatus Nomurabacteria bacterium RIFCSPHIGHO2_01_FULL_42_15]|uniref:ATP synthase subunit delta n=1 Tax=Candidatus Nomurabacteria bacterium RIFCSPHIGHO2_01_FULL_42_15 TaxID=1801742 RepID=A0A1F6VFR0_9BACT|nr:MAG: ATP synthase F1 subunit delta [Candidatus Nomurabacteria bacterium RIFCSPHIGHO2_01_FULL_42_15]OGI93092.1 MAG: ATP synthase F1 subunit delta [Candidatus Nomurabacteria bacterium RIFCSPLOWO2_01_FULL_41_18]
MTVISNNDIARAIYSGAKEKHGHELSLYQKNVVNFLFRKRLLSKAPEILSQLRKIINKEEGRIIAKVSSVEKLSHKIKEDLTHSLKKRYSAKEVILEEKLDEKLIGGIKLEVNNEVIDLSVKNKIGKLQEHLERNI